MRPICHRLKWLYLFEAFSHLNVQYGFNTERENSSFFPALGATAASHLRASTCILLSSLLQVETCLCQVGTLDAPHFSSLMP